MDISFRLTLNCYIRIKLNKQYVVLQVDASLNRAKKKESLNKTAHKVQLMRLKGKAVGSKGIPMIDRVYFLMYPPLTVLQKSNAVFVAKQWSIGRVIDSVADLCDIPNRNNQTAATKLRLFHHHDGQMLCTEMEIKLDQLLNEGSVMDGETLVLEYVNETDPDSFCLKRVDHYKD